MQKLHRKIPAYTTLLRIPYGYGQPSPRVMPANKFFTTLKKEILGLYERTKPMLFEKLILTSPITSGPSLYLKEISTASKVGFGDAIVHHKFLQVLLQNIKLVLASQRDLTLAQLGKLADELSVFVSSPCHAVFQKEDIPTIASTLPYPSGLASGLQPFHFSQRPRCCQVHIFRGPKERTCKQWFTWLQKSLSFKIC